MDQAEPGQVPAHAGPSPPGDPSPLAAFPRDSGSRRARLLRFARPPEGNRWRPAHRHHAAGGKRAGIARLGAGLLRRSQPHLRWTRGAAGPGDWPPPMAGPAGTPRRAPGGKPPVTRSRAGKRPDLAVLVGSHDPEIASALVRDRIPHLAASAGEAIGVVGPLVVAGQSACLRCLDLARSDRDPAWPLILAQLAGQQPDPLACDAPLAAAVAALAAAQALAFIDRPAEAGATMNGTLELVLPDWQWRRRTWPPHRECDCGSGRRPR